MDTFTKSSEFFKAKIQSYLEKRVAEEPEFGAKYSNPEKNLDECFKYICSQVYESGCCGFDDDEVFGMAVHYYDEKDITIGEMPQMDMDKSRIVCYDKVVLSEEEMAEIHEQARQRAIEKATEEARRKLDEARKPKTKPITATTTTATEQPQLDLFGGMWYERHDQNSKGSGRQGFNETHFSLFFTLGWLSYAFFPNFAARISIRDIYIN